MSLLNNIMESSNAIINNIVYEIALKIIDRCYEKTLDMVDNDEIELGAKEYDTEKIVNELLHCKDNDMLKEDVIKIQNIIQEKDEKIKEIETKLKEIKDININLTIEFNKLLDRLHE